MADDDTTSRLLGSGLGSGTGSSRDTAIWWGLVAFVVAVSGHALYRLTQPRPLPRSRSYYVSGEVAELPQGAGFSMRLPLWQPGYAVQGGEGLVFPTGSTIEAVERGAVPFAPVAVSVVPVILGFADDDYEADLWFLPKYGPDEPGPPPPLQRLHVIGRKAWSSNQASEA